MPPSDTRIPLPTPRSTPYGILRGAPFAGDTALPSEAEVVIIGGGILGAVTALNLAKRNIPVVLCEKAEIGCEASSRAFGWVSEIMVDTLKQPMTQLAKRMWDDLHAEAGETGFRRHGVLQLAETPEELEGLSAWLESCSGTVSDTRLVTAAQVRERLPTASRDFAGGLLCESDGSAEPVLATAAIAQAARRAGARIVTGCAVRGLNLAAGRIAGVYTEKGYIKTSMVLCAANAWSRLFCGNHGVDVPQIYAILSMGRTGVTDGPVGAGGVDAWAWRRQIDGSYALGGVNGIAAPVTRDAIKLYNRFKPLMEMMGSGGKVDFGRDAWNDLMLARRWNPAKRSPFERLRVLAGKTRAEARTSLASNARVFPEMAGARVEETWSGPLTLTPDNMPILGAVSAIPGFHLATGCTYGITWAPAIGKLMADIMTGHPTDFDAAPYRLERFFDGSPPIVTY